MPMTMLVMLSLPEDAEIMPSFFEILKNISITMQQTGKCQTHLPYLELQTLLKYKPCLHSLSRTPSWARKRAGYAHALSAVERVLRHFLWDPGPLSVTISKQKIILLLKFACILGQKKLVA